MISHTILDMHGRMIQPFQDLFAFLIPSNSDKSDLFGKEKIVQLTRSPSYIK